MDLDRPSIPTPLDVGKALISAPEVSTAPARQEIEEFGTGMDLQKEVASDKVPANAGMMDTVQRLDSKTNTKSSNDEIDSTQSPPQVPSEHPPDVAIVARSALCTPTRGVIAIDQEALEEIRNTQEIYIFRNTMVSLLSR